MIFGKMREWFRNGDWGLKILSLVLAIVIYHAVKSGSVQQPVTKSQQNERSAVFKAR
jgi:YbbR domain-containing protein